MKELPIYRSDARSRFARRSHDRSQIICLLEKRRQLAAWYNPRFTQQFEPKRGFVRFFFHCSNFSYEFRLASSTARGTVIRSHRRPATDNLIRNGASCDISFRNGPRQFDNSEREVFGALFQFDRVHNRKVLEQSAIANRQSSIPL